MKLTFKDLKQQKFVIEAEPSDTIGSVKSKIAAEKGWEPSSQKLIYSGKILQDDNTVESYKIEEKGFIVCMTQKPKAAPKPAAEPSTPAPATVATPAPPAAPASTNTAPAAAPPATPSPAPASTTASTQGGRFNDPSALALGDERAAAISNMEAMGFPRADIDRAMRAAFFNPDRAVEYLLNGIPESALREERPAAASPAPAANPTNPPAGEAGATAAPTGDEPVNLFEAAAQAGQGGRGGARGGAGVGAGAGGLAGLGAGAGAAQNLDFLRNNPQFQQLRQVVQQQPQMLEPILQQVAAGNPQLAQMITQNPEQFMQLLADDGDDDAALPLAPRLFRDLVIQAYFACDKNEELAANFLFDQPDEPED
ncbi:UV excision repair protein rad23 [Taxawa tesnikishii (nom. ined.)]|nr:UV excision repair protein rad23 [Dothideales sp. JES 119]